MVVLNLAATGIPAKTGYNEKLKMPGLEPGTHRKFKGSRQLQKKNFTFLILCPKFLLRQESTQPFLGSV